MQRRRTAPPATGRAARGTFAGCAMLAMLVACNVPGFGPLPDEGGDDRPEIVEIRGGASASDDGPRELHFVIPPAPESNGVAYALPTRTIYLNRNGGTYTPGYENSSTNTSTIPIYTSTIGAWNPASSTWNGIVDCMRDEFAPFNVEVTEVDPGAAPHMEAVVGGYPEDLQLSSSVGGASPFASDCSFIERSIVFVFPDAWNNDPRIICEVIAHEIGHSVGLDHEYLCEDPMTYLEGCGNKTFQNAEAYCGESYPTSCYCSATQNSFALLTTRLGPADANAPTVAIDSPADGAVVAPGFAVEVEASDDVGITHVELHIDGSLTATITDWPYDFSTDPALADGTHVIEARAYDSKHVSSASISVQVQRGDDPSDDPPDPSDDPGDDDTEPPATPNPAGAGDAMQPDLWKGCAAGGRGGNASGWLVALLLLTLLRRRKHA